MRPSVLFVAGLVWGCGDNQRSAGGSDASAEVDAAADADAGVSGLSECGVGPGPRAVVPPIEAVVNDEEIPALLFDGTDIARSGHLVVAVQRYIGEVPADEEHPLTLWAQPSPGVWERCQTLFMPGADEVAVAPN